MDDDDDVDDDDVVFDDVDKGGVTRVAQREGRVRMENLERERERASERVACLPACARCSLAREI